MKTINLMVNCFLYVNLFRWENKQKKIAVIAAKNRKNKSFAVVSAKLDNNIKEMYNGFGDEKWL